METSRLLEEDGELIDCLIHDRSLVPRHSWLSLNVVVETFVISGGLDWTLYRIQVVAGVVGHNKGAESGGHHPAPPTCLPSHHTAYKYYS